MKSFRVYPTGPNGRVHLLLSRIDPLSDGNLSKIENNSRAFSRDVCFASFSFVELFAFYPRARDSRSLLKCFTEMVLETQRHDKTTLATLFLFYRLATYMVV